MRKFFRQMKENCQDAKMQEWKKEWKNMSPEKKFWCKMMKNKHVFWKMMRNEKFFNKMLEKFEIDPKKSPEFMKLIE